MLLRKLSKDGFDVSRSPSCRKFFLKNLRKKMGNHASPIPTSVKVPSSTLIVPKFSLMDQIMDIVSSPTFQDINNLVVNGDPETRFHKYITPIGQEQLEVHSARWYQETYDMMVTNPETDLLFPIQIYTDATPTDAMQRFPLEPVMFTTTLLKRSEREKSGSWRHLGFIPPCDDPAATPEQAMQSFHDCLNVILTDLKELQRSPPVIEFYLGGVLMKKRLLLPVAFVMGDQLSQDKHCGRKSVNGGGAGRLHRRCWCSFMGASDPLHRCVYIDKDEPELLRKIIREEDNIDNLIPHNVSPANKKKIRAYVKRRSKLAKSILGRVYSMYPINNAWTNISFGSNLHGIYRASLDDPMHYLDSGSFLYLSQVAFLSMTDTERSKMERIIKNLFQSKRSGAREDLPRGKFSSGFTRTTLLTAGEKIGLILSLYVSLGTDRGKSLYTGVLPRIQDKYESFPCKVESLPKMGDVYFFSDLKRTDTTSTSPLDRSDNGIAALMETLELHDLGFVLHDKKNCFDELQIEYLLQSLQPTLESSGKDGYPNASVPGIYSGRQRGRKSKNSTWISKTVRRSNSDHDEFVQDNDSYNDDDVDDSDSETDIDDKDDEEENCNCNPMEVDSRRKSKRRKNLPEVKRYIPKHRRRKPKVKGSGATSSILSDVDGFRYLIEKMLSFHSMIHYFDTIPSLKRKDTKTIHKRIQELINLYKQIVYRGDDSVDCDTCKMHSHLHLADDIEYFGDPMNWEASKGERGLKFWAKLMSYTAQKQNMTKFLAQTTARVADSLLLSKCLQQLQNQESTNSANHSVMETSSSAAEQSSTEEPSSTSVINITKRKHPHLILNIQEQEARISVVDQKGNATPWQHEPLIHHLVVDSLIEFERALLSEIKVYKDVTLHFEGGDRVIRAFSKYDDFGPFFDWVTVSWPCGRTRRRTAPGKLLLIYEDANNELCAIVQACA